MDYVKGYESFTEKMISLLEYSDLNSNITATLGTIKFVLFVIHFVILVCKEGVCRDVIIQTFQLHVIF
jgi:hypothetical protein